MNYLKSTLVATVVLLISAAVFSKPVEKFENGEDNFNKVMKALMEKYIDKNLTKEQLYEAATKGMLESLNSPDRKWNTLLDPQELRELEIELSGKVTGIGAEMKFEPKTGYATILRLIPGSAAEKAGLQVDDQILSVRGRKFKGQEFSEMVSEIRGEVGHVVTLKILREDKIVDYKIKRQVVPWTPVELEQIDESTALLTIGLFNQETPRLVSEKISKINRSHLKNLIIDLRDNSGGGFSQALKSLELFIPKDALMLTTKDRDGKIESFKSTGGNLDSKIKILLLVDKKTSSGAEFFAGSLREVKGAKVIGENTFGKWTAQSVETLPNKFAIKYTIMEFFTPHGLTFKGEGLRPDLEIMVPESMSPRELKAKNVMAKRIQLDPQLKAAVEMSRLN
jgi:carboxyl-terminal processing protease